MAQFDYYDDPAGGGYLLSVQSDLLDYLNTRVVIPLLPADRVPGPLRHLHPTFDVRGRILVLATHLLTAIPASELTVARGSLEPHRDEIVRALDTLLSESDERNSPKKVVDRGNEKLLGASRKLPPKGGGRLAFSGPGEADRWRRKSTST